MTQRTRLVHQEDFAFADGAVLYSSRPTSEQHLVADASVASGAGAVRFLLPGPTRGRAALRACLGGVRQQDSAGRFCFGRLRGGQRCGRNRFRPMTAPKKRKITVDAATDARNRARPVSVCEVLM